MPVQVNFWDQDFVFVIGKLHTSKWFWTHNLNLHSFLKIEIIKTDYNKNKEKRGLKNLFLVCGSCHVSTMSLTKNQNFPPNKSWTCRQPIIVSMPYRHINQYIATLNSISARIPGHTEVFGEFQPIPAISDENSVSSTNRIWARFIYLFIFWTTGF